MIPGLAAQSSIFEGIRLDPERCDCRALDWQEPKTDEDLQAYVLRMVDGVDPAGAILLAVSLGVMVAYALARQFPIRGVILISSVKSLAEMPGRFRWLKLNGLVDWLPMDWIGNRSMWALLYGLGIQRRRIRRYNRYMGLHSANYLRWCLRLFILGDWCYQPARLAHLHGDRDSVFPIKNLSDCTPIRGGTHAMVVELPGRVTQEIMRILNEWINE